jgi:hypothetical protein
MLLTFLLVFGGMVAVLQAEEDLAYTETFHLENCKLLPRGVNDYFIPLRPWSYILLEGEEEDDEGESELITVCIQVLPHKKVVDGVRCAVILEREWVDEELVEISWNYFAICRKHKGVFYFGEDVDIYEDGEVVSHDGAWLAGVDGAKPGMIMPGLPLIGSRYYQEIAPDIALDRAEHIDNTATIETEAGTFENCLLAAETTPLEPDELSLKAYAPGIGLVLDDAVRLIDYGHGECDVGDEEEEEEE